MKLNRDNVAKMCAKAGIMPAARATYKEYDVFIGDGRVDKPDLVLKRFGVPKGSFPFGCYCTSWFVAKGEGHFEIGAIIPFDIFHDPQFDAPTRRQMRINTALAAAHECILTRGKIVSEGNKLHA